MKFQGASKNSEFAQMPHKETPIRYGQNSPCGVVSKARKMGKQASRAARKNNFSSG